MTDDAPVPLAFRKRISGAHGAAGREWIERLPRLVQEWADRHAIEIAERFRPLSYSWVAPALRPDGQQLVVKAAPPTGELVNEIEALRALAGRGIVQLVDADADKRLLLLERLVPGTPVSAVADDRVAISLAMSLVRGLSRPPPPHHRFPTVGGWGEGFRALRRRYGGPGPLPERMVARAERLFTELAPTIDAPVLIHGDLHQDNILAAGREPWVAIDPKGVIGEPAYEVGALIRNPMSVILAAANPRRLLERRVDQIADELSSDRARIVGWAIAQSVLAAWWMLEDHGSGWESSILCAEMLSGID